MSIVNRFQAYSSSHPISINRKLDQYLSEKLPDLMDEFKIADRSDIQSIDQDFEKFDTRMAGLEVWREDFSERISVNGKKLDRIKKKNGME